MSSDQAQTDCDKDDIPSAVTNQTDKPVVKRRSRNMPLHIITSIPSKPSSNSAIEDPKSIPSTSQMASATTYDAATQHTFVVSDLERRIRDSARLNSSTSTPVSESSNCSNSLTGSSLTLTPDPLIISSLESSARTIAANLDVLLRDLRGSLHGMSDLTVEASECYADSISSTCDSVDAVIKNTYSMLAKIEELNEAMVGVKRLAHQVKEIKRVVDIFESHFILHPL